MVYQTFANKFTVSDNLHPYSLLGPFEKWNIDLMNPLPVTKKEYCFIIVVIDYLNNLR